MTIENGIVNGTNGTDRTATPKRVWCCGCRRSLPWSAAVLCSFEGGINHPVTCVWHINGGLKAVEDYRTPKHYRDPRVLRDFHAFGYRVLHLVAACCGLLQLRGKI